jgi:branched-chain amino acid transport system substrate-binding protein
LDILEINRWRYVNNLEGDKMYRSNIKLIIAIIGISLIASLISFAAGCEKTTTTTTANHIKIGTIMGITGPLSVPSLAFNRAWGFYEDKVKEDGGIKVGNNRYIFDFVNEDSKGTAEGASIAANKLVTQDKVKFIIGAMLEPEIAAIYQVTKPAGVLYGMANVNIPGHAVDVSADKPLQVRLSIDIPTTIPADLDYILKTYPNAKKIAIAAPDIGYEGMIADCTKDAQKRGMSVIFTEKWAWGTTDFVPTYTRVLNSKPDIILAMNSGQANDQLKAARQLGFKGPFISNSPLGADVFVNTVKDPNYLTDVLVNSPDIDEPNAAMKDLMARWSKKYPNDPFVSDAIHSYDMPWIIAQAMVKAQSIEPEKVMATLETMINRGDITTNLGPGYMGGKEKYGVNRVLYRPLPLTRIMNGKMEFIGFFNPEK